MARQESFLHNHPRADSRIKGRGDFLAKDSSNGSKSIIPERRVKEQLKLAHRHFIHRQVLWRHAQCLEEGAASLEFLVLRLDVKGSTLGQREEVVWISRRREGAIFVKMLAQNFFIV